MKRLSVVIPNYNYEQFVGEAIESALALDWPDVEVVVVDDGSTDDSLGVIHRYEDRVRVLSGANATQRVAVNRGLGVVTGDVVIVLDSDDVLPADLPGHLAAAWGPGVSKAQFRMQRVDAQGAVLSAPFPTTGKVDSARLRGWFLATTAYPTPPGSANAYAKWFLDLVVPVDGRLGAASDSALLAAAPVLGDVVDLPDVVVSYRRHGGNDSDLLADPRRFAREVERARARWEYAASLAPAGDLRPRALFRSRELLQLRAAAIAVDAEGARPIPGDCRRRVLWDALRSPWHPGPEPVGARLLIAVWSCVVLLAPARARPRLLRARYGR